MTNHFSRQPVDSSRRKGKQANIATVVARPIGKPKRFAGLGPAQGYDRSPADHLFEFVSFWNIPVCPLMACATSTARAAAALAPVSTASSLGNSPRFGAADLAWEQAAN